MRRAQFKARGNIRHILFLCLVWICSGQVCEAGDDTTAVDLRGDFRYRYETTDNSGEDISTRTRHRIRARIGLEIRPAAEARLIFQIASGSDDLVSSNQTLSGTFSSKNIVLDLAYGEYQPHALAQHVTLIVGKAPLPFFRPGRTELLWDSDLRPEGISGHINLGSGKIELKVLGGYYILEEREDDDNSYLNAGQIVGTISTFPKLALLKAGVGYFHFTEIQDRMPFFNDDFFGNSYYPDTTISSNPALPPIVTLRHQTEYRELEFFVEAGFFWHEKPVSLMADYVTNTKPEADNTGWLLGLKFGNVTRGDTWSLRYNYRRLERDAVYGTFTDSNFRDGGTDGKGHEVKLGYGPFRNTELSLSYFHNWTAIHGGDKYQRWSLDILSTF